MVIFDQNDQFLANFGQDQKLIKMIKNDETRTF